LTREAEALIIAAALPLQQVSTNGLVSLGGLGSRGVACLDFLAV